MASNNIDVATTLSGANALEQVQVTDKWQKFMDVLNATSSKVDSLVNSIRQLEDIIGIPLNRLNTSVKADIITAINSAIDDRDFVALMGDLQQLSTTTKANFVEAINEIAETKLDESSVSDYMQGLLALADRNALVTAISPLGISNVSGLQAALNAKASLTALDEKQSISERNQANGYAGLNSNGKIPSALLPPTTVSDVFVAGSQAEMLSLSSAGQGDVCVRNDIAKNFILKENDPTVLANWVEMATPAQAVSSVAGRTGAIVLAISDIDGLTTALSGKAPTAHTHAISDVSGLQTALNGKAATSHTHTIANITNLQTTLDGKMNVAGGTFTSTVTFTGGQTWTTSGYVASPQIGTNQAIRWNKGSRSHAIGVTVDTNSTWQVVRSTEDNNTAAATSLMSVDVNGNFATLGNMTAFSDIRLKANITPIEGSLDIVSKLRGVRYTRKDIGGRHVGLIAQEVMNVLPEVVHLHKVQGQNDTFAVNYGAIVAVLIQAVNELSEKVRALEADCDK